MEVFNELVLVKTSRYAGTDTPNKNGVLPFWLEILAGRCPNRQVQDGTVMARAGFELGKTYLASCRKRGDDSAFGEDYGWNMVMEVTNPVDVAKLKQELGNTDIFTVERPEGFRDTYERKGNAIESLQTVRAKEGKYTKVGSSTSTDHRTASNVKEGTSVKGATDQQRNLAAEDLNREPEDKKEKAGNIS